jgi:hypothetical protein
MNTLSQQLRAEIERTASQLGIAPSTVGERAGQGGRFYARLLEGRRVWPETAEAVRVRLHQMVAPTGSAPVPGASRSSALPAQKDVGAESQNGKGAA